MSSVENAPSVEEIVAWIKSKVEDRSHSCDAVWRLLGALDEASQGVVGGYLDLEGQAMVRAFLASPESMLIVSRAVYDGKMAINRMRD